MQEYKRYWWYVPALYVAGAFASKLFEGLGGSVEFARIISVIPFLAPFAALLTPLVGIWDAVVAFALLFNMPITGNRTIQSVLFVWTMLWPFIPAMLRVLGSVGEFEIGEVLSIAVASGLAWYLWARFAR